MHCARVPCGKKHSCAAQGIRVRAGQGRARPGGRAGSSSRGRARARPGQVPPHEEGRATPGPGPHFRQKSELGRRKTPPTNQPASPPNRHPTNTPFIHTNRPARGTRPELQQNSRAAPLGTPPRLTRNLNSPRTRAGRGFARTHSNCSNPIGIQSELDRASALLGIGLGTERNSRGCGRKSIVTCPQLDRNSLGMPSGTARNAIGIPPELTREGSLGPSRGHRRHQLGTSSEPARRMLGTKSEPARNPGTT